MFTTPLLILVAVVIGLVLYSISIYNTLQTLKTQIAASIQEIGNQLKRQASLIPNLESAVKSYLKHEKGIFELLANSRDAASAAAQTGSAQDIESALSSMQQLLPQIRVAVEDNPELKSNESVEQFMRELSDTADKLMYARRSLIDLTQRYNQMLVTIPSNLIASMFGFKPEAGLHTPTSGAHVEVSSEESKDVRVDLDA